MYTCTGASPSAFAICGLPPESRRAAGLGLDLVADARGLRAGASVLGLLWTTAALTSALNARASIFSPSWISIARRVLPSRLELNSRDGSGSDAPRANV